jgi:hypothetical protein
MDVLDVETTARPAARSSDTKAALAYLKESGAVAICITERDGDCAFTFGKIDPNAVEILWIAEANARAVVRKARKLAGKSPDVAIATAALHQAASDLRATLTPHATAMMLAGEAATRLDGYIASLRARCANSPRCTRDVSVVLRPRL